MSGQSMRDEIAEQPDAWSRLLEGAGTVAAVAEAVARHDPGFVLLAARGTSDHAALYGKYLIEVALRLPAGLASPSTVTAYGAEPRLRGGLFLVLSQSGGSPDLLHTLRAAKRGGALTLAVTNAPASPLAQAADLHLDIAAGPERAVAATKSYTAQLLALYLLVEAWAGRRHDAAGLPALGRAALDRAASIEAIATRYRFAQRLVVTGRGYAYPTAREAALKLMETSYVAAQAFSGADLLHGPLAMLDRSVPVLAVVPEGAAGRSMADVLPRIRAAGSDLLVVGGPGSGIELPPGIPEPLSPLIEIIPFQLLALHAALQRGEDPDAPRGLAKVTRTT